MSVEIAQFDRDVCCHEKKSSKSTDENILFGVPFGSMRNETLKAHLGMGATRHNSNELLKADMIDYRETDKSRWGQPFYILFQPLRAFRRTVHREQIRGEVL